MVLANYMKDTYVSNPSSTLQGASPCEGFTANKWNINKAVRQEVKYENLQR